MGWFLLRHLIPVWPALLYNQKCSIDRAIMEHFLAIYGGNEGAQYFQIFWKNIGFLKNGANMGPNAQ